VTVVGARDVRYGGVIRQKFETAQPASARPFTHYLCELDDADGAAGVGVGDVAVWELPPAEVVDRVVHTAVCDDLAAAAAAISAMDVLVERRRRGAAEEGEGVPRLLFTRAEEIGFIGAIAACRGNPAERLMPADARVIALENSRSFADSPINGGPIVRVGDRLSVFSPSLSGAIAARAEQVAGGPASVTASQKNTAAPAWKWQRKLMSGGACEATVYCHAGYEATCVCLPLGNYHNMAELAEVQAGTNTTPARVAREFIGLDDYHGLVDLLVACGMNLPESAPVGPLVEKLWRERAFVLESRA
jgi:endoglucanase